MTARKALLLLCTLVASAVIVLPVYAADTAPFTVVLLPDTQYYSQSYPETYKAQMQWIRDNAEQENIKFAIHLGDIVQTYHDEKQWEAADAAHKILDGHVPYSIVPGNHDVDRIDDTLTRETPLYDKYFPPERFAGEVWYGGHMGDNNACNYCTFEGGGMKFLVVSLAFAPSDEMLAWADGIIKAHPEHRVILATHFYMRVDGRGKDKSPHGMDGHNGETLWKAFVKSHPSIFMVVRGHIIGVNHQISTNDAGKPVIEILCDYQGEENGGNGWLQTMRFVPEENKIEVEAYSPTLNQIRAGTLDTYTLEYAMTEKAAAEAAP